LGITKTAIPRGINELTISIFHDDNRRILRYIRNEYELPELNDGRKQWSEHKNHAASALAGDFKST
jgi:hypothetical protein